jgi:hypothetical protein
VLLQAGYEDGPFGTIFDGSIIQAKRGRENATDTYLDIVAADGDQAYNFAVVNTSLPAGSTAKTRLDALTGSMAPHGVTPGYAPELPGAALPRGRVLFGMARDHMRTLADSTETKWSIQSGKVDLVPLTGVIPGEAIVLNAATGMVGIPEQTQDGIKVRCLLNPEIRMGRAIQIDNASINRAQLAVSLQGQISERLPAAGHRRRLLPDHRGRAHRGYPRERVLHRHHGDRPRRRRDAWSGRKGLRLMDQRERPEHDQNEALLVAMDGRPSQVDGDAGRHPELRRGQADVRGAAGRSGAVPRPTGRRRWSRCRSCSTAPCVSGRRGGDAHLPGDRRAMNARRLRLEVHRRLVAERRRPAAGRAPDARPQRRVRDPGPRSQPRKLAGVSTTHAQLRSDDGLAYVDLDPAGHVVKIKAPGGIVLDGDVRITGVTTADQDVNITGTATATTDVVGGGKHLKTHIHSGVTPGGGNTGAPV